MGVRLTACVTTQGTCAVVTLGGYIDVSTHKQLQEVLAGACRGVSHLVIDMSRLEFMDSTGLTVLIEAYRRLDARGATLDLAAPQPIVAKVLEISGLDQVFRVHASLLQAVTRATGEGEPAAPMTDL